MIDTVPIQYDTVLLPITAVHAVVHFIRYCTMCNATLSCGYLWVLVCGLTALRTEYGREKQVR